MKKPPSSRRTPLFVVRHSPIHGHGVFAARRIRKGTTVVEYLGDRVSHAQADARYEDKDPNDNHTFLFTVDAKTVIDGGVNGNEARYINHGCDPNCESATRHKRIFIDAIRTIEPGEELAYDYQIQRDSDDPANVDQVFACRCGAKSCRGSMLEAARKQRLPPRRPSARAAAKRKAAQKNAARKKGARKDAAKKSVTKKNAASKGAVETRATRQRTTARAGAAKRTQRRGR